MTIDMVEILTSSHPMIQPWWWKSDKDYLFSDDDNDKDIKWTRTASLEVAQRQVYALIIGITTQPKYSVRSPCTAWDSCGHVLAVVGHSLASDNA